MGSYYNRVSGYQCNWAVCAAVYQCKWIYYQCSQKVRSATDKCNWIRCTATGSISV